MSYFKFPLVLFCFLLVVSCWLPHAYAADTLSVSPSLLQLDLATDKPEAQVFYTNHTTHTIELSFSASDVTALEDGYKLSFLDPKTAQNYNYRLSSWISFGQKTLLLNPGETNSITVFINQNELTPGGHYGSILAEINQKDTTGQAIQVRGVLSSLVFVRTNTGKEIEAGNIHAFDVTRDFFDFPNSFFFRLQNTGDTDLTPYGLLQVYDMWGNQVSKGIVNDASAPTLPESIRRYDVPVKTSRFLFPGIYHANLSIHFGKKNIKEYANVSFFSQGSIPLIPLGIGIVILGIIVYKKRAKKPSEMQQEV